MIVPLCFKKKLLCRPHKTYALRYLRINLEHTFLTFSWLFCHYILDFCWERYNVFPEDERSNIYPWSILYNYWSIYFPKQGHSVSKGSIKDIHKNVNLCCLLGPNQTKLNLGAKFCNNSLLKIKLQSRIYTDKIYILSDKTNLWLRIKLKKH